MIIFNIFLTGIGIENIHFNIEFPTDLFKGSVMEI